MVPASGQGSDLDEVTVTIGAGRVRCGVSGPLNGVSGGRGSIGLAAMVESSFRTCLR